MKKEILIPYVLKYGAYFGTESLAISSSMFVKRYAVLTVAAALDYYGFNKKTGDWWSLAKVNPSHFSLAIDKDFEESKLDIDWKKMILTDHLCIIIELLSKECKVPKKLLWENVAVRLNAVIRDKITKCNCAEIKLEFAKLYQFSYVSNGKTIFPFHSIIHSEFVDEHHPKRKTCCRYYEVSLPNDLPYCLVCPLENVKNKKC